MNCHCWGVSFGKPDFIFFVGKWEPELYKMEENVLQKLCSKAKLDRDKGLQDLEELLKQFDREHVQNLEKHFSATLSDPNAEWETKHGALMGSKAICQTPFCSEEFSSYLIDQALLLADDSEFRVRIASGRCLPSYSCTQAIYEDECYNPLTYIHEGLTFLYTNADNLINKMDELRARVVVTNPDIIIITEVQYRHRNVTIKRVLSRCDA